MGSDELEGGLEDAMSRAWFRLEAQGAQQGVSPNLAVVSRVFGPAIAVLIAMLPGPAAASSAWGSPGYGDPPGWCTRFSDMWTASIVSNDPLVGTNPERNTFYGFHPDPGYD